MAIGALSLALCFGTNFAVAEFSGRPVYLGTTELAIALVGLTAVAGQRIGLVIQGSPRFLLLSILALSLTFVASAGTNAVFRPQYWSIASGIELVRWFTYLPLVVFVPAVTFGLRNVRWAMAPMAIGLLANAAETIWQVTLRSQWEARPAGFLQSAFDREGGSGANPNVLGLLLAIGACFAFSFVAAPGGRRRTLFLVCLGTLAAGVVATGSRSALLGMVVGLGIELPAMRRRRVAASVALLCVLVLLAVLVERSEYLRTRTVQTVSLEKGTAAGDAILDRMVIWRAAMEQPAEFVWLGVGYNSVATYLGGTVVDNLYFELLIAGGLPCLLAAIWMWVEVMTLAKRLSASADAFVRSFGRAGGASMVAVAVASLSGAMALSPRLLGVVWCVIGGMIALDLSQRQARIASRFPPGVVTRPGGLNRKGRDA